MVSNSAQGRRFYYAKLLLALAMAAYIGGVLGSTDPKSVIAGARRLRSAESSTEKRVLDGIAKIVHKVTSDKQKAANQLFKRLKLHKTESNLFTSRKFDDWMNSVKESYKATPAAADAAMFFTLRAQYGDDGLAKILQSAKPNYVAKSLEHVQLKYWVDEGKSADDVFKLLKLDDVAHDPVKNPAVGVWMSYVEMLKGDPNKLLFTKLKARYSDEGLARMLALAQNDAATNDAYGIAWKLEYTLREQWLHQDRSADYVFKLLRLDEQGDELFKSPVLKTWFSYVSRLDNRNQYESMFSVLKTHYSDEALAPMLTVAKVQDRSTLLADRLKGVQFKRWMKDGKDADDVFALYRLDKEGDELFESLGFRSWASCVQDQGGEGAVKAMLQVLRKHYDDEALEKLLLVTKERSTSTITELRNELWLSQGKTIDQAYSLLQLDTLGGHVLFSADLGPLVSYAKKVAGKVDEKSGVSEVISLLAGQFGLDFTLARMLSEAISKNMGTSRDNKVPYELQKLQFKQWFEKRVKPQDITVQLVTRFDKFGVLSDYQRFYRSRIAKDGK